MPGTIIVSVLVACVIALALYFTIKNRKKGCNSCGSCPYGGKCDKFDK